MSTHLYFAFLLDLRLKRTHNPFDVVKKWDELCARNTEGTNEEIHDCQLLLPLCRFIDDD